MPEPGSTLSSVLKEADKAMYDEKNAKRYQSKDDRL